MTGDISFDGVSLQSTSVITNRIQHINPPAKLLGLFPVANANASALTGVDYPSRVIRIRGVVHFNTETFFDLKLDEFKAALSGKEKNLDIGYLGTTRRYIATVSNITFEERDGSVLFVPFTVDFVCTEPFGMNIAATTIMSPSGVTTATRTETPTVNGTAPQQLPVFTIDINALTGTGDYIQISNNTNDQAILVIGVGFQAGDQLIIDCEKREVRLNDVLIDYTGTFLELEPGAQSITYSDGFDTRDVDILAQYKQRFL